MSPEEWNQSTDAEAMIAHIAEQPYSLALHRALVLACCDIVRRHISTRLERAR